MQLLDLLDQAHGELLTQPTEPIQGFVSQLSGLIQDPVEDLLAERARAI